jgi:hypothetical protein
MYAALSFLRSIIFCFSTRGLASVLLRLGFPCCLWLLAQKFSSSHQSMRDQPHSFRVWLSLFCFFGRFPVLTEMIFRFIIGFNRNPKLLGFSSVFHGGLVNFSGLQQRVNKNVPIRPQNSWGDRGQTQGSGACVFPCLHRRSFLPILRPMSNVFAKRPLEASSPIMIFSLMSFFQFFRFPFFFIQAIRLD